jgi:hypothetical protein
MFQESGGADLIRRTNAAWRGLLRLFHLADQCWTGTYATVLVWNKASEGHAACFRQQAVGDSKSQFNGPGSRTDLRRLQSGKRSLK